MSEIDAERVIADFNRSRTRRSLLLKSLVFVGLTLIFGLSLGFIWRAVVAPPAFVVGQDGSAMLSELAAGKIFRIDVSYVSIGLIAGLVIGTVCWALFRVRGLLAIGMSIFGSLLSALACWGLGVFLGPKHFAARVSEANSGMEVPVDFTLRSPSALAVWVFGSLLALMLLSAFERAPGRQSAKRSE